MKTALSSLHKCSKCELNFLSKEGMEKHSARVHEGKAADFTRYKCEKCKSDFRTKQDFKQHKLPAKSMGSYTVCQNVDGENTKFVNICEFTEHRNNHEKCKNSCIICPYIKEATKVKSENFSWKIESDVSCSSYEEGSLVQMA